MSPYKRQSTHKSFLPPQSHKRGAATCQRHPPAPQPDQKGVTLQIKSEVDFVLAKD